MKDKVNETAPEHQCPLLERLLFEKKLQLKGVWTCRDAAQVFGVGARTISDWVRQGKLNVRDLPGHGRFLSQDLENFLQSRLKGAAGGPAMKRPSPPYIAPLLPFPEDSAEICVSPSASSTSYMQNQVNLEDTDLPGNAYTPSVPCPEAPQNQPLLPQISSARVISPRNLQTLHDVLTTMKERATSANNPIPMMRSTLKHLIQFLTKPADQMKIAELAKVLPEFKQYLERHGYQNNSIRSYLNYAQLFVRKAIEMGWREADTELQRVPGAGFLPE